jgi:hypothetical protein
MSSSKSESYKRTPPNLEREEARSAADYARKGPEYLEDHPCLKLANSSPAKPSPVSQRVASKTHPEI